MSDEILTIRNMSYSYPGREIFRDVNLDLKSGVFYALLGESGSGKTTFLSIIAGQDDRYQGEVCYLGREIREIGLTRYRRSGVSTIYQNYNLLGYLNAVENVMLAMDISDNVSKPDAARALELLDKMGIDEKKARQKTSKLSGGEQQRVAIARSLLTDSPIIAADEPTGNLDWKNGEEIVALFEKLAHENGKCVVMVTHNEELARKADVIMRIDQKNTAINVCYGSS